MRNKKIITSIILLATLYSVDGQVSGLPSRFTNDSTMFTTWSVQPDWEKDKLYSETIVQVKSLDSTDWNKIKLLDRTSWLALLNDPKVDWVANLALYELYRKDASIFRVIKTRNDWITSRRKDDIAYWEKKLK